MTKLQEAKAEGIAQGKAEGIAQGKAEGITAGKLEGKVNNEIEITYKLLQKGYQPIQIHELLEFPIEFVNDIKQKLAQGLSLDKLLK